MKVKNKLRLGFGFLFIVVLFFGAISLFYINQISNSAKIILKDNYESLSFSREMRTILDENTLPLNAASIVEFNNQLVTDAMFGGMRLTLEPDGTASINPGGDIVFRATYNISGNKISVQVQQTNTKYKFTIISDEEISNENGVILKLAK